MKLYIAGFFDTRERLYPIRDRLKAMGHVVTSRWLGEDLTADYQIKSEEYWIECAKRDKEDILRADVILIDTLDVTPRGGREVEYGIAMMTGKLCYVVGPLRNVFHRLAHRHFHTWEECIHALHSTI